MSKPSMSKGDLFTSKACGQFKVLNYTDCENVEIEFIKTGYKNIISSIQIRRGTVKDRLFPSIYGVGFLGDGVHKIWLNGKPTKAYAIWSSMVRRCYSAKDHEALYKTYKDCSVCAEWLNFQNFAEWFDENYIEGYDLDKDIKIDGNKIYSPEFCLFVTKTENTVKASAKSHKIKSPKGDEIEIYNLEKFCRENKLSSKMMWQVMNNKITNYKGFTKSTPTD